MTGAIDLDIDDTELRTRTKNALANCGYRTVSDLVNLTRNEILRIPEIGNLGLNEILTVVKEYRAASASQTTPSDAGSKEFVLWCFRHRDTLEKIRKGME